MGCWDELCVVSGIRPGGGPKALIYHGDLEEVASAIAEEVDASDETHLTLSQLRSIITEALTTTLPISEGGLSQHEHDVWWIPDGLLEWHGFDTSVAIGHFDEEGECPIDTSGEKRKLEQNNTDGFWPILNGVCVEVRRVREGDSGSFEVVVVEDGDAEGGEREEERFSQCTAAAYGNSPNFFVLEGCYRYLEAWLDPSISPQVPSKTVHGQSLPLAGEFYELIHSQKRDRQVEGLPDINYDGIEKTLIQWQDFFIDGRKGARNISRGIAAGLRSKELVHSIVMDFRCLMFMRPDSWPYPPSPVTALLFSGFSLSNSPDPFTRLPTEICSSILYLLPLSSLLALSSASKSLRNMITDSSYLKQVIKRAIFEGSLRWVLPVSNFPGDEERALATIAKWIPEGSIVFENSSKPTASKYLSSSVFPHVEFIRACFEDGSMLNRKRLWDNVKQFDGLWRDYRLHGWQCDRFQH